MAGLSQDGGRRAFAGAFIFGVPLLFTMEMWWIGEYLDRWKLGAFLLVAFAANVGLSWAAGFKRETSFGSAVLLFGFALVFVVLTSTDWLARPTLPPALLYGVATVVFPFFIMQPALGLGIATMYQELDVVDGLSIAENIFLGHELAQGGVLRRRETHSRAGQ